jgi:hypothetical protein
VLFDGEKSLRANEAGLTDFAAFAVAGVQRDGESVPVRAACDLAENQISAWKIGNHQCRPTLSGGRIVSRKKYDNYFAGYRFDHAASSSGEFQSRPKTDSLSSAPLNPAFSSESLEATSFWFDSRVFIKQSSHLSRRTRSTQRNFSFAQRSDLRDLCRERSTIEFLGTHVDRVLV